MNIGELEQVGTDSLGHGDQNTVVEIQVRQGEQQACQHSLVLPTGKDEASFQWSASDVSAYFRLVFQYIIFVP